MLRIFLSGDFLYVKIIFFKHEPLNQKLVGFFYFPIYFEGKFYMELKLLKKKLSKKRWWRTLAKQYF